MFVVIGNLMLAFVLALLMNFARVWFATRSREPKREEIIDNISSNFYYSEPMEINVGHRWDQEEFI